MRKYFLLIGVIFSCYLSLIAQNYNMSNDTITTCGGKFFDSGGSGGSYGNNEGFIMTFCASTPGDQIKLVFLTFNLQNNNDYMYIFDGPDTTAPQLTVATGLGLQNSPGTVQATSANPSGCITILFKSNANTTQNGWSADISCETPCQIITSLLNSTTPAAQADGIIRVCQGASINFNGTATFSKSPTGATYIWDFDNGTTAAGKIVNKVFSTPGIYLVNLNVTDPNGCINNNKLNQVVHVSTIPNFSGTGPSSASVCVGATATMNGVVAPTPYTYNCSPPLSGTTFLPDGTGVSYKTSVTVDCFDAGLLITSGTQINDVCMNMEHSYMGDLSLSLSCPNGSSVNFLTYATNAGGGTVMGNPRAVDLPVDANSGNTTQGTGMNYCFAPGATKLIDVVANWNALATYTDVSGNVSNNINQVKAGTYKADGNWDNFIGCPLNGNWTIKVTDNLAQDNGYIFSWGITFAPSIVPPEYKFTPIIVSQGWLPSPDIIATVGNNITIRPTSSGSKCYTYRVVDNFGCTYDTVVCINVTAGPFAGTSTSLNTCGSGANVNLFSLLGSGVSTSGTWTGPSALGGAHLGTFNPGTNISGVYTYTVLGVAPCLISTSTVSVTNGVASAVQVSIAASTNPICAGTNVTFTATPTNGGTPSYQWKLNGVNVGSNLPTYSNNALSNGDLVSCVMNSSLTCITGNPATSNVINMAVNPILPVSVFIAAVPSGPICSGTNVTFTATPTNGGAAPVYQWKKNGVNVGSNSVTYSSNTLVNTDKITCVLTSNVACPSGNPATSNQITITVNPNLPVSVSIAANNNPICAGTNVTFTATPTNGGAAPAYQWKRNGVNVGANSATYSSTTLVNGDIITCVLTSNATCPTGNPATSNQVIMTVNPNLPVSVAISANNNPICAGTNVTFTAVPTNGGAAPVYQWKKNGVNVGSNSTTYSSSTLVNGDIITCVLTSNATCPTGNPATSNQVVITVTAQPTASVAIVADNNSICAGTNVTFTATPTNGGTPTYQWKLNGVNVGSNSATYSNNTLANGDNITCIMTSSLGCVTGSPATSNQVTMTVNAINPVVINIAPSANPICAGTSVTFTGTPANAAFLPVYQWTLNGANVGVNSNTYTNTSFVNGDVVACVLTFNAGCVSNNPATSNNVVMTVNPDLPVSVSISADNNPICAGTNVTFTAVPTNGGAAPVYQWKKNGVNVGANATTYSSSTLVNGDIITCVLTSNATCPTGNPATSNQVVMSIVSPATANISISADDNSICAGTNVTFTAVAGNGGGTPTYQWKLNGANVGTNSNTYSNAALANNDVVFCVMTSSLSCVLSSPASSNIILMSVSPNLPVSVSIAADDNNICAGTNVTFTATPTNGGVAPVYQWKKNGVNVGSNSTTYSSTAFANGDIITCVLTSNAICPTGNPATSNSVVMVVNPNLPVSVSISSDNNNICAGTNVTFTAVPTNGGAAPVYQWKRNGVNVGANATTYSSSTLVNGDIIICELTSNAVCPTGNPATSNSVVMVVNPNLPVSVSISADNNNICAGTNVTFTAVPTNGGAAPVYQWKLNGANVGANAATYSSTAFANGDIITCVLTSNAVCPTGNPATSNAVTMTVNPNLPVSISIAADDNNICAGTNVTFTATPTNGGAAPVYQWKLNGANVGANAATYSSTAFANGDIISCVLTSNAVCPTGNPATSNPVVMVVNPNLPVSVSISADNNNICAGTNVTFTAVPTNGGAAPVYQWKKNGVNVGSNSATYSSTAFANGDIIICELTSNAVCPTGNPATSNSVVMVVNPNLPVSVSIAADDNNICAGTNVTFTAVPTNGGAAPVYQWKLNGANVGANAATYSSTSFVNGDIISCVLTSNAICPTGNPATSNSVVMVVNPNLPVSVSIVANKNPICLGDLVVFTATPTNGGAAPVYQWTLNGTNVGTNSSIYSNNALANNDKVNVTLTSNATCATGSPAISNEINMDVQSIKPNIVGDIDFCFGDSTLLDAGVGFASYLWSNGKTTQTVYASNSGNLNVRVSNAPGCIGRDTIAVTEFLEVKPVIAGTTSFCFGGNSNLDAGAGYIAYTWSNGQTTQVINVSNSDTYAVVVEDANGCFGKDDIVITENPEIIIIGSSTDAICFGTNTGTATVVVSGGTPGYTYLWSNGQTTNPATGLVKGTYTVTVKDRNSCPQISHIIVVNEPTELQVNVNATSLGCYGDQDGTATAIVSGGTAPYTYLWNNGSTEQSLSNLGVGQYSVAVMDANLCKAADLDSIVEVKQLAFDLVATPITCFGDNDGLIEIQNVLNNQGSVRFLVNGSNAQTSNTIGNLSGGNYTIIMLDSVGCSLDKTTTIIEPAPLLLDLGVNITLLLGESSDPFVPNVVGNQGDLNYLWTPDTYLTCTDCEQPICAVPLNTTNYTLVITDAKGCTTSDNLLVTVEKPYIIYVPTAFSPNGDGTNDLLQVMPAIDLEKVNVFRVFNRWGEMVYEAYDFVPAYGQFGWDGYLKGNKSPLDVYIYQVDATFIDGKTMSTRGQSTLLR
ncbi:MAG: PKD domain-containing protein [Bacteroidetes bacterium]|nr:PKD domain-containing protein [Bacteroidota bacterium]